MRLANSPYYGSPRRVSSTRHATVMLGFDTVRAPRGERGVQPARRPGRARARRLLAPRDHDRVGGVGHRPQGRPVDRRRVLGRAAARPRRGVAAPARRGGVRGRDRVADGLRSGRGRARRVRRHARRRRRGRARRVGFPGAVRRGGRAAPARGRGTEARARARAARRRSGRARARADARLPDAARRRPPAARDPVCGPTTSTSSTREVDGQLERIADMLGVEA